MVIDESVAAKYLGGLATLLRFLGGLKPLSPPPPPILYAYVRDPKSKQFPSWNMPPDPPRSVSSLERHERFPPVFVKAGSAPVHEEYQFTAFSYFTYR